VRGRAAGRGAAAFVTGAAIAVGQRLAQPVFLLPVGAGLLLAARVFRVIVVTWGDNSRSARWGGGGTIGNFHYMEIACRFNGTPVGIRWNRAAKGAGWPPPESASLVVTHERHQRAHRAQLRLGLGGLAARGLPPVQPGVRGGRV
jgi:hypothetical protein